MAGSDLLLAGVLFLFAAVIAVPLASRLGIGAVLGYLLAGIAIGPWGLGFISDVDEILHFSELGVVFLMFIIGLELNPAKLWRLRSSIFGVGAAQVMLSAAILGGLLMTTGFSWQAAVVGGIGLAMSSTAMALQLMREKGMSRSEAGQLGFSVLLFQDLAVIPALALVPLLAGSADEHVNWLTVGMKVLAFAGMLIGGRYLLRPVFRFIASSGVREVFTAATLLLVLGSALFMEALGLSMALGTFIAGVLLAESESPRTGDRYRSVQGAAARVVLYFRRHGAEPWRTVYPSAVGGGERGGAGGGKNAGALSAGPSLWPAKFRADAVRGRIKPGRRVRVCPLFAARLSAVVSARPDGAAAGGGNVVDDDDAAADEGDR